MKSYATKFLVMSLFVVVGGLTAVNAQVDSDAIFRVNIPFSFNVREKSFPAGEYSVKYSDDNTDGSGVMQIATVKGKGKLTFFETIPIAVPTAPKEANLIFGKVQGQYFLSEIWENENPSGNQVEEPVNMKKLEMRGVKKEREIVRAEMT
ncbi:MAG TPA: hypothetical protein PLK77_15875, partial [Pyrinomonadaceae bacterium]|nr:hypothetical protein [Pyrinomonadaceae bacterium]